MNAPNASNKTCLCCERSKPPYLFPSDWFICGWCLLDQEEVSKDWVLFDQERKVLNLRLELMEEIKRLNQLKESYENRDNKSPKAI